MKIAVVGTGYVGLVTGTGFSDFGHDVTCVDIDPVRVATLRQGEVPFYEPGLHDLIKRNTKLGRLHFTTSTAEAVAGAEIAFIAVDPGPDYVVDKATAEAAFGTPGAPIRANAYCRAFDPSVPETGSGGK